jgi:hypothetical protein
VAGPVLEWSSTHPTIEKMVDALAFLEERRQLNNMPVRARPW